MTASLTQPNPLSRYTACLLAGLDRSGPFDVAMRAYSACLQRTLARYPLEAVRFYHHVALQGLDPEYQAIQYCHHRVLPALSAQTFADRVLAWLDQATQTGAASLPPPEARMLRTVLNVLAQPV